MYLSFKMNIIELRTEKQKSNNSALKQPSGLLFSSFAQPFCQLGRAEKQTIEKTRVSVQEIKSLGGHFACLCRWFEFYEVQKNRYYFSNGNIFTLLIIFIVKSLQKEQNI